MARWASRRSQHSPSLTEPAAPLRPPPLNPACVRGLVFDLDGTLVDSYGPIGDSVNAAREHFGLAQLSLGEVRRKVGHGLEALLEELLGPSRVREGVEVFRRSYATLCIEGTTVLPGVREALEQLREQGLKMAVASNKPACFGEPILRGLGLLPFFCDVQGPDRSGSTKPEPAMIHACLRAMGVSKDEAAYVGDMALDVESAARAELAVILVDGGSSPTEILRRTGEIHLPSLAALPELLQTTR